MQKQNSGRENRRQYLNILDTITELLMLIGGGLFGIATIYLLYGLLSGSMVSALIFAKEHESTGFAQNLQLLRSIISISGSAFVISVVIRYYQEEVTAYLLLVVGVVIYWGMPVIINASMQNTPSDILAPISDIDKAYTAIGITSLVLAIPLIIIDLWKKVLFSSYKTEENKDVIISRKESAAIPIYAHCWQLPHCREYLRKHCASYKKRKDCWRLKSGCYCDEEMMLQAMKSSGAEKEAIPTLNNAAYPRPKKATSQEKKERCIGCMLYILHQRQKYRLFSPFAFPLVAVIMFVLYRPLMMILGKVVEFSDRLALALTIAPGNADSALQKYTIIMRTSDTIEWILFICISLVLVSITIRLMEYIIFELQM